VLLALLALAIPPIAFVAARRFEQATLLQATAATCGSGLLGGAAVLLGRRGRRNIDRTLGRLGGARAARAGRLLGAISLCLGLTAGVALGVYALLNLFG
jgi:peptidoglycan/LPS O-acetylase OafA/YrhL